METKLIKFNLNDRGRKHTGIPRNYNVKAICDSINSPETQERVETRGILGLYGHWARLRFGLDAAEGGIAEGKAISLEPALVTTYIKASYDGTVEHKAEFLDTKTGNLAAKLYQQKVGGFSTALSALDSVKPRFHGFDYVNEANYLSNSILGEALDSATGEAYSLDSILQHERDELIEGYIKLLDVATHNEQQAKAALDSIREENEHLLSMLSADKRATALDSIHDLAVPIAVSTGSVDRMMDDAAFFKRSALPHLKREPLDISKQEQAYDMFFNRFFK